MFRTLAEISAGERAIVGGKAAGCALMWQAGFPVPDGVVVGADVPEFRIGGLPQHPWFDAQPAGATFAVRSSGIDEDSRGHSFAGVHRTLLNVARGALVGAVVECRRSARSPEADSYRRARGLESEASTLGVLVQRMVAATVSGVAFTVNPVTGVDEFVVNAAPGLGEALVSGRIEPDEFIVRKQDRTVTSSRPASSRQTPILQPAQILDLADLLARLEQRLEAPQDVEFCFDGRQFWIVQSRPITTRRTLHPTIEWTRANLAEVLPEQTSPQALDVYVAALNEGERRFFGRLMAPESALGPMVKTFHGRPYFNLSQLRHIAATAGAPFADTLRSMGHAGAILPDDEVAIRAPLRRILRALPDFLRLAAYDVRARQMFAEHEAMTRTALERLSAADPATLDDREIWATVQQWLALAPEALKVVFVMTAVQIRERFLRKACAAARFPYEQFVYPLLAAGPPSVSTRQAIDLVSLAVAARGDADVTAYLLRDGGTFADFRAALAGTPFLRRFDSFLERYGHRGRYESDWSLPRLRENPAPALFAVRGQLERAPRDPAAMVERQRAEAEAAWRGFTSRLSFWQRLTLLPRVRSAVRALKNRYVWREQVRSDLTRVVSRLRDWHLVLAGRFVERGWIERRDDYFLLLLGEIGRAIDDPSRGPRLRDIASERAARRAEDRDLLMPLMMRESDLPALLARTPAASTARQDIMTGLCVSPGCVVGEVVVMRDPAEFAAMKPGAILVAPATDPSWTPLFTLASGVIVEVGGMLSHASTIAREFGLPALANVHGATRILKSGDRIRLDASAGRVERATGPP